MLPWLRLTQMSLKRSKTNLRRMKNKFSLKIAKTEFVFTGTRQRIRLQGNEQTQLHIEAKNTSPKKSISGNVTFQGFHKKNHVKQFDFCCLDLFILHLAHFYDCVTYDFREYINKLDSPKSEFNWAADDCVTKKGKTVTR